MALAFSYKDPNEVVDYVLDWSLRLDTGDTIDTSTWTIVTTDGELVIQSDTNDDTTTTVWLTDGTDLYTYELLNRVVTAGGRTFDQTVKLRVKSK